VSTPKPSDYLPTSDIVYNSQKRSWYARDPLGKWININEESVKRRLVAVGFTRHRMPDGSSMEKEMTRIQDEQNISYAGPLAGWPVGIHKHSDDKILVTTAARPLTTKDTQCNVLLKIVTSVLGEEQFEWFKGLMKTRREAIRNRMFIPGPIVIFVGPAKSYKSFIQRLITELLGGRLARPWRYMSGQTTFNGDLFGAEHLCIEDDAPPTDSATQTKIGSHIKSLLFADNLSAHFKGFDATYLKPIWTMSMSTNDEPSNLLCIPPIDESLEDKIALLKTICIDSPWTDDKHKKTWMDEHFLEEVQGLAHIIDQQEIRSEWRNDRTIIKAYKNSDLLNIINNISPEEQLLNIIDETAKGTTTKGKAIQIDFKIRAKFPRQTEKIADTQWRIGVLLGKLARKHPRRVTKKTIRGSTEWTVLPPINKSLPSVSQSLAECSVKHEYGE
jgi:hypothetical protein